LIIDSRTTWESAAQTPDFNSNKPRHLYISRGFSSGPSFLRNLFLLKSLPMLLPIKSGHGFYSSYRIHRPWLRCISCSWPFSSTNCCY
jgi:hypothetical protein